MLSRLRFVSLLPPFSILDLAVKPAPQLLAQQVFIVLVPIPIVPQEVVLRQVEERDPTFAIKHSHYDFSNLQRHRLSPNLHVIYALAECNKSGYVGRCKGLQVTFQVT